MPGKLRLSRDNVLFSRSLVEFRYSLDGHVVGPWKPKKPLSNSSLKLPYHHPARAPRLSGPRCEENLLKQRSELTSEIFPIRKFPTSFFDNRKVPIDFPQFVHRFSPSEQIAADLGIGIDESCNLLPGLQTKTKISKSN